MNVRNKVTSRNSTEYMQSVPLVRFEICTYKTGSGALLIQKQFRISWCFLQFGVTAVVYTLPQYFYVTILLNEQRVYPN
jgi:hypothetical protein